MRKRYQAPVDGHWTAADAGEIELPVCVDWPNRPKQHVDHMAGRPSLTRYRVLDTGTPASRAKAERLMLHACRIELCHPETGEPLRIDCPPPF